MSYWEKVKKMIRETDIVVEVLDSRFPEQTRINVLEDKVEKENKELVFVVNKSDLISVRKAKKIKQELEKKGRCIFVSATKKHGSIKLKETFGKISSHKNVKVAFFGYPNVGKSSIINMLKGKKSASISPIGGHTKGLQMVRISKNVMLIDSPGVIPLREKDEALLALFSAKNPEQLKDPEQAGLEIAEELLKNNKEELEELYGKGFSDSEELLEQIALQKKKLYKGGKPDTNSAAKILIRDFQQGKIKL